MKQSNFHYLIIYLKTDNTYKFSIKNNNFLEVGDYNGFGHLVVGKYIFYNGYFVTRYTFSKLYHEDSKKQSKKEQKNKKLFEILEAIKDVL